MLLPWLKRSAAAARMSERRSSKRVAARLKVWCEGDDFTLLAETVNVSRRGLFVRTSTAPPSSGRFKVTIQELDATADVEVRWRRGSREAGRGGMGLLIMSFERGANAFEEYVEKHSSRSGEHKVTWPPADGEDPGTG
jgi:hypothetical protein